MPFSIENMLQLREFKDCTVIAGHKGINRVIQCVDTMEVPDITPWLQCGELLITTGLFPGGTPGKAYPSA